MFIYIVQGHTGFQGARVSELPRSQFRAPAGGVVDCIPISGSEERAFIAAQDDVGRKVLEQIALTAWQHGQNHELKARESEPSVL